MKPLLLLALCLTACGQPPKVYRCTEAQNDKLIALCKDRFFLQDCLFYSKIQLCDTLPTTEIK